MSAKYSPRQNAINTTFSSTKRQNVVCSTTKQNNKADESTISSVSSLLSGNNQPVEQLNQQKPKRKRIETRQNVKSYEFIVSSSHYITAPVCNLPKVINKQLNDLKEVYYQEINRLHGVKLLDEIVELKLAIK